MKIERHDSKQLTFQKLCQWIQPSCYLAVHHWFSESCLNLSIWILLVKKSDERRDTVRVISLTLCPFKAHHEVKVHYNIFFLTLTVAAKNRTSKNLNFTFQLSGPVWGGKGTF